MMFAKLDTLGLLKVKKFQYKGYDVLIVDYDVTNQIYVTQIIFQMWSCDQSLVILGFL